MCKVTKEDIIKQLPNILTEYLKESMKYEMNEVTSDIKCVEDKELRRTECFAKGKAKEVCVRFDCGQSHEHLNLCNDERVDIYFMWSWNKETKDVTIIVGAFWDSIII